MVDVSALHDAFGRILQAVCLCALPVLGGLCGILWLHEHDVYILRRFRGMFRSVRGILGLIAIAALVLYGGTKPTNELQRIIQPTDHLQLQPIAGDRLRRIEPTVADLRMLGLLRDGEDSTNEPTYALTQNQIDAGFALARIGTNETHDFTAPADATVYAPWRLRGANINRFTVNSTTDAPWSIPFGTDWIDGLTVCSTGVLLPKATYEAVVARSRFRDALPALPGVEATDGVFAPFRANLGVIPEMNWGMLPSNAVPSEVWWALTPSNSVIVTWRNALLGRDTNTPVCVQAELFENGNFVYRYDLSRAGLWDLGNVTNILVGAFNEGHGESVDVAAVTNLTSLFWHRLDPLDTPTGDRDGDGLSTAEEIFRTRTDPGLWDTDGDGLSDGEEDALGTDPLSRDFDHDGLVDGSDPDPSVVTPLADLDADGIPDAYEDYWFGGTNVFNVATNRDETGFTLDAKILGGINPTNDVADANVASTNSLVSWKLFDGFAADWPADATNLVWERTFAINRTSAWQQFFLSAAPTNAAPWGLRGMTLEWETDDGMTGSLAASPSGDSFRLPFSTNDFPYALTLRLRATGAHLVHSPTPVYLIAYAPKFTVSGGNTIIGQSGTKFHVFMEGSDSEINVAIDHSMRPCNAAVGEDELDMDALENMDMMNGDFSYSGDATGGTILAYRPGVCELPDVSLGVSPASPVRRAPRRRSGNGDDDGGTIVVLDPSAHWNCNGHGCGYDGLGYDWYGDWYYEEEYYPLDSKCLRRKWYHDWGGGWHSDSYELSVSSGAEDGGGWVSTEVDGDTGRVYVDGIEVWSDSPEHVYDDTGCGGGGYGEDYLGDGCDSCDSGCENGNCDDLEGPDLASLKFRIPLGAPGKGQVAGFAWFSTDYPIAISRATFQVLSHPDASISDTTSSGTRRILCTDERGRDLRMENITGGVRITIYETASQKLEHTWEITNVGGNTSVVRLRKISRLNNVMSDETFTYSNGDWTRFDNIAGVGTELVVDDGLGYGGVKCETRTTTDAEGNVLACVTTEKSRIGECDNAVIRETCRSESTGRETVQTYADYWNDPAHSGRHGQPRLVWGNARAWVYTDYDDKGHETLRVEQRGNAAMPSDFPYVVSNVVFNAGSLSDAFVTVRGYSPLSGDSCHEDDAARPRTETRYVVTNGVATVIGRTWHRYTRLFCDGYYAIKHEAWKAATQDSAITDAANAYSYEITYADTDDWTPLLMKNAVAESLDENGILTVNDYSDWGDILWQTSRKYHLSNELPTYEIIERDSTYGNVLRRTVCLAADDTVIADEQNTYDEKNRLRSTTYLDGTSTTNSYSCCRLLWSRDREGRTTLRSAQTGTDHLYYANEDTWLSEVSTNGHYRTTMHFFDALGRETNTVVLACSTPGEANDPSPMPQASPLAQTTTAYPYGGSDYSVATDERGKVAITRRDILPGCIETGEAVFSNGVEVVKTKSRAYFGGGSSMRREWGGDKWTEERRFTEYAADGRRVEYTVTDSHDHATVTNSVSVYDLLGRLVASTVPGANGSAVTTDYAYDGASGRKVSMATTGSQTVTYGYDEFGDLRSTVQEDVSVLNVTSYETIDGETYRVATRIRMTGSVTNSVQIRRQRLTGLSDALRSRVVSVAASGRETVTEQVYDSGTGLLTSVSQTDGETPETTVSRYGLVTSATSLDEHSEMSYDEYGRQIVEEVTKPDTGAWLRTVANAYDLSGNVVTNVVTASGESPAVSTFEYDILNREVSRTDALGHVSRSTYDALGRLVLADGDRYSVATGYDAAGRKTSSRTTRNGGATWDETQWEFDPASGVNTAKTYADSSRINYTYTDNGKQRRTTWARGAWREHAYNDRNQISSTAYSSPATPSVTYTYTDAGKTASAASSAASFSYAYDERLLCTNETVQANSDVVRVARTYDGLRRVVETAAAVTNVRHAAKVRLYDSESRVCGYALTNSAGRGVSVVLAYDGSYLTNKTFTLPNGSRFNARLTRRPGRMDLVSRRDYTFNGQGIYWFGTDYDVLGRPTNAVDSVSTMREWLYNRLNELDAAAIGTNRYGYAYDTIGNSTWAAANAVTNAYAANSLNQYTAVDQTAFVHDADGNLVQDGRFAYAYDAENRLVSVRPLAPTEGSLADVNTYDHKHRRIRKVVERYTNGAWETAATHVFTWDGDNIVLERIAFADGTTRTVENFWGNDKSGTEQGAGGVEGLLAVSVDGAFYFPCYGENGNIVCYVSEQGTISAQYVYDPYGNVIESYGTLANLFSFGFSTKYHDREVDLIGYQRRFYRPDHGRWLNRDPIEESGGENLYAFCANNAISYFDPIGNSFEDVSNFCAGVGDSLSFGVTRLLRRGLNRMIEGNWDDPADVESSSYAAGEYTEVAVEITVTLGGATLRHIAKHAGRTAIEGSARQTYKRAHNIAGGVVHHVNPIKGHPPMKGMKGGQIAQYPLPFEWAARGDWNMNMVRHVGGTSCRA